MGEEKMSGVVTSVRQVRKVRGLWLVPIMQPLVLTTGGRLIRLKSGPLGVTWTKPCMDIEAQQNPGNMLCGLTPTKIDLVKRVGSLSIVGGSIESWREHIWVQAHRMKSTC